MQYMRYAVVHGCMLTRSITGVGALCGLGRVTRWRCIIHAFTHTSTLCVRRALYRWGRGWALGGGATICVCSLKRQTEFSILAHTRCSASFTFLWSIALLSTGLMSKRVVGARIECHRAGDWSGQAAEFSTMVIKMLTAPLWIQTGKYGSMLRWETVDPPISCSLEIINQTLLAHVFFDIKSSRTCARFKPIAICTCFSCKLRLIKAAVNQIGLKTHTGLEFLAFYMQKGMGQ